MTTINVTPALGQIFNAFDIMSVASSADPMWAGRNFSAKSSVIALSQDRVAPRDNLTVVYRRVDWPSKVRFKRVVVEVDPKTTVDVDISSSSVYAERGLTVRVATALWAAGWNVDINGMTLTEYAATARL